MSAAATAAGYLYASGRLRGRAAREQEEGTAQQPKSKEKPVIKKPVRVAPLPVEEERPKPRAERPKRVPRIEYRTRRWKPENESE
jgi:hypothetical protein